MANISYICMSDLHFGQDTGVFTNVKKEGTGYVCEPLKPNAPMQNLAESLRAIIKKNNTDGTKPTLILAGDAFELALNTTEYGAMIFGKFIESFMPDGKEIFGDIIFIPGNHDHHLWERSRETQYFQYIKSLDPDELLPDPWHTTKMLNKAPGESEFWKRLIDKHPELKGKNIMPESTFLTQLVQRQKHLADFTVHAAYPNFGIANEGQSRVVMFSHGHYIESMYQSVTTFMDFLFPERGKIDRIYQLETENFAWIDFFWSALGRSGGAGKNIELLYNKLLDADSLKELIVNAVLKYMDINLKDIHWYDWFKKGKVQFVEWAVNSVLDKILSSDKKKTGEILGDDAAKGLKTYLEKYTGIQLFSELKKMPDQLTFVFGHTHKPFEEYRNYKLTNKDNQKFERNVALYNTGGWVVETTDVATSIHGASAVVIDEELNITSLRLYNEGNYKVRVNQASSSDTNPLFDALCSIIEEPDVKTQCDKFSDSVEKGIAVGKKVLQANIDK